ncbi:MULTISPECIES: helix-turn-helix domain-containing protein [Lacrimispora]|uniref:DNA-binding Xre family transcriptional regulator n=2 Tax=Lacrimispora TaxID=2719231 RepID=A0A2M8Z6Z5_9FIRM|nr:MULTISPECIES: helix-turn-helix transcriptional regulator [Lacrimispora]PJJ29201.1 DNA-binding Xre family transcriptional regulator [[Clostridium] celerecrescens 18A]SET56125.1 DNA-binding transcriptional regulator, XRE family [[Clostridium] sphenoides JCM 1415]SUY49763.1 putative transcriptional regulator [Lacrimispora sphenoides]
MSVNYDKLWKLLIDKKMKKTDFMREAGISSNALAHMGKNESVSLDCIERACRLFGCKVDDLLDFVEEEK